MLYPHDTKFSISILISMSISWREAQIKMSNISHEKKKDSTFKALRFSGEEDRKCRGQSRRIVARRNIDGRRSSGALFSNVIRRGREMAEKKEKQYASTDAMLAALPARLCERAMNNWANGMRAEAREPRSSQAKNHRTRTSVTPPWIARLIATRKSSYFCRYARRFERRNFYLGLTYRV